MRRLRLVLEYDGTEFHGFQAQPGRPTVQAAAEAKLSRLMGQPVTVVGAGRTDTGVHASGQVVHWEAAGRIPTERIAVAFNSLEPYTVFGRDAAEVGPEFHARYSAVRRAYRYYWWRDDPSPFLRSCVVPATWLTDEAVRRMQVAVPVLVGEHDFTSFCAVGAETPTRVRTVLEAEITAAGPLVSLRIAANGFLHSMVRIIAGTLAEIGQGRRDPETMADILAARDRRAAAETAPPRGLFLTNVAYRDGFESGRAGGHTPVETLAGLASGGATDYHTWRVPQAGTNEGGE